MERKVVDWQEVSRTIGVVPLLVVARIVWFVWDVADSLCEAAKCREIMATIEREREERWKKKKHTLEF